MALNRKRILVGALIGLVAGFAAFGLGYTPLFESWERKTLDIRSRWFAKVRHADPNIVAVVIDQNSITKVSAPREEGGLDVGWPWPRDFHAAIADFLIRSGARAVAFDMIFSEPSIYTRLAVVDDDRDFAAATAGRPVVQSVMLRREPPDSDIPPDKRWPEGLLTNRGTRRLARLPAKPNNKATLPVAPLIGAAAALGWIGFEPDEDGICRSMLPAAAYAPANSRDAVEVWSLPFALAMVLGAKLETRPAHPAAEWLTLDGRRVPLDEDGRFLLRFHGGEGTYQQFPAWGVLHSAKLVAAGAAPDPAAPPESFRDKIVIVGATAEGLLDFRATSLPVVTPGYVIHATALDNLLHGDGLVRPALLPRTLALLIFATVTGALFGAIPGLRTSSVVAVSLAIAYMGVALWVFSSFQLWLLIVTPVVAVGLANLGVTGYGYLTVGRERKFLRNAFGRYVAPEVVDQLVKNPGQFALGGETRELTIMFADVAGFTTLSEGRPPAQLVQLMNECFTEITNVIQGHGGTVDKFIGDAVMAFWNAPVEYPDHAARACRATQDLLKALVRLNVGWAARGLPAISMRVGAATGPALVGNVGSSTKFNYTVMGDTVNLASRLEGAAKVFGTLNLVAGSTVQASTGAVSCRELDWLAVKGKSEAVPVFEVMPGEATPNRIEAWERYAAGLAAYRARKFDEAIEQFEAALKAEPDDGPSKEMVARCNEYLVTPPPDDWRGEHVLHSK